ncbi:MAG: hypothetical protein NVSMB25_16590 [Thermoleophilaceae bacterium]
MAGGPQLVRTARRLVPVAIELYRRWERLPPERKEHYRRAVRKNAEKGRRAVEDVINRRR